MKSPIYYLKWHFVVKPKLLKELKKARREMIEKLTK
jgi:hypothetical protein